MKPDCKPSTNVDTPRSLAREKFAFHAWGWLLAVALVLLFDFFVFPETWSSYARAYSPLSSEQTLFKIFVVGFAGAAAALSLWCLRPIQMRMIAREELGASVPASTVWQHDPKASPHHTPKE